MATMRAAFRITASPLTRTAAFRPAALRQSILRNARAQSTAASDVTQSAGGSGSRFQQIWNSKVGPKTVHFWAPIMKWALVLAGLSDMTRPAESLSLTQNAALMATGAIWTRWCLIIKPRNVFLATVNFFVGVVGATQCTRIYLHNRSLKQDSLTDEIKDAAQGARQTVEVIVNDPKRAVKQVTKA